MSNQQYRFDTSALEAKASVNDQGFLTGSAVVTRTGVFTYQNQDGTIRRELRHPDDVFKQDSIRTMRLIPVTNTHPLAGLVTPDNAKELSVGNVGEDIAIDGKAIVAPFTVTHADAIQSIKNGRRELSLGYVCDLVDQPGIYDGEPYDVVQKNIKYNHLAFVDRARAGQIARLNLDGFAVQVDTSINNNTGGNNMNVVTYRIDGIEYQVQPEVERHLSRINADAADKQAQLDEMTKEKEKLQGQLDQLTADMATLQDELKVEKEKKDSVDINGLVSARVALEKKASLFTQDSLDGLSNRKVMEKVIALRNDGLKLEDKSDDYVTARFDALVENFEKNTQTLAAVRQPVVVAERKDHAREAFENMQNAYKLKGVK